MPSWLHGRCARGPVALRSARRPGALRLRLFERHWIKPEALVASRPLRPGTGRAPEKSWTLRMEPLNRPPGTFSPTGGEGQDEEARFMVREHLQKLDVNRSHEPWRSGVSAEGRNSWEQQPAALCRDAATGRRFLEREHLQKLDASWGHEPATDRSADSLVRDFLGLDSRDLRYGYGFPDWDRSSSRIVVTTPSGFI